MDDPKSKRAKKSDKGKASYERNGGFSQKHVRLAEALRESRAKPLANSTESKKE
jgi:hypothetical protein